MVGRRLAASSISFLRCGCTQSGNRDLRVGDASEDNNLIGALWLFKIASVESRERFQTVRRQPS
jgi:hypothetical protein